MLLRQIPNNTKASLEAPAFKNCLEFLQSVRVHEQLAIGTHTISQVELAVQSLDTLDKKTLPSDGLAATEKIMDTKMNSGCKILAVLNAVSGSAALRRP